MFSHRLRLPTAQAKGLFIFYQVTGGGELVGFKGSHEKKMALSGGGGEKYWVWKGGSLKIPSSFAMMASAIVQTAYHNAKNRCLNGP